MNERMSRCRGGAGFKCPVMDDSRYKNCIFCLEICPANKGRTTPPASTLRKKIFAKVLYINFCTQEREAIFFTYVRMPQYTI